jgi:hypothetical protein
MSVPILMYHRLEPLSPGEPDMTRDLTVAAPVFDAFHDG